eukprot:gene3493-16329_t
MFQMKTNAAVALIAATSYGLKHVSRVADRTQLIGASAASWATIFAIGLFVVRNAMFVPGQFLPAILVGWGVDREQAFTEALSRASAAAAAATVVERAKLETDSKDIVLDGCKIQNKDAPTDKKKAKVIVWLNANGVIFEQNILFAREYAHRLQAHAILFNYRGVGASTGWPYVSSDLGKDGITAVKYAIATFGVEERNIIIHGHSIGGGVMSMVVGQFPDATIINDRSFWDLGAEASILMQLTGLCKFMGGLFGAYVMIVGWIVKASMADGAAIDMSAYPGFSTCMMAGSIAGWYLLGKSGAIVAITPNILTYMGWLMESGKTWDASRGLVIYHKGDGMIPYEGASLHNYLQNAGGGSINSFELTVTRDPQFNHMAPLNAVPEQWELLLSAIKQLLNRGRKLGQ